MILATSRIALNGLSPSTRGNPGLSATRRGFLSVYPRPRGGTRVHTPGHLSNPGLSPPTRGNLQTRARAAGKIRSIPVHAGEPSGAVSGAGRMRSIPAHAGEPRPVRLSRQSSWVYPRPRGGTDVDLTNAEDGWGLSPPTRGNRRRPDQRGGRMGSIPVHAGEPTS